MLISSESNLQQSTKTANSIASTEFNFDSRAEGDDSDKKELLTLEQNQPAPPNGISVPAIGVSTALPKILYKLSESRSQALKYKQVENVRGKSFLLPPVGRGKLDPRLKRHEIKTGRVEKSRKSREKCRSNTESKFEITREELGQVGDEHSILVKKESMITTPLVQSTQGQLKEPRVVVDSSDEDELALSRNQGTHLCLENQPSLRGAYPPNTKTKYNSKAVKNLCDDKASILEPLKRDSRIPEAPYRLSINGSRRQDVINNRIDESSLPKMPKPRARQSEYKDFRSKETSLRQNHLEGKGKQAFSENKDKIAKSFLAELDNEITSGKISRLAAPTGGVKIKWTNILRTTAGRALWSRRRLLGQGPLFQFATIELNEKLVNDENRLLNVIAHEFCHLATFMVSNITADYHGKQWLKWGKKCSSRYRNRGINVVKEHDYL